MSAVVKQITIIKRKNGLPYGMVKALLRSISCCLFATHTINPIGLGKSEQTNLFY